MMDAANRQEALAYVRHAIALCDDLGEALAACHLQLGADILTGDSDSDTHTDMLMACVALLGDD